MRRTLLFLLTMTFLVAACGEAGPLDGLGDASRQFVYGETSTTTTVVVELASGVAGLVATADVLWLNDEIADQATGSAETVIESVWQRRAASRFVQASRSEIATALPTLRFPAFVATDTRWVTSQLVYDPDSGDLDIDTAAAFGLWRVEPYTVTEGRLMVLRVGIASDGVPPEHSEITAIDVPDGLALVWTETGLRYELFCRSTLSEELCLEVAQSFVPLREVLSAE